MIGLVSSWLTDLHTDYTNKSLVSLTSRSSALSHSRNIVTNLNAITKPMYSPYTDINQSLQTYGGQLVLVLMSMRNS